MTMVLLASLLGLALVDSLNPSLFAAQVYLMTTPRPVARIAAFLAGVMIIMLGGGTLLLIGAQHTITRFINMISEDTLVIIQILIGLALFGFGGWYRGAPATIGDGRKPRSLRLHHAFALGVAIMLNEITTALPYFVAIERIAQSQLDAIANALALLLYNAIFSAPLLLFLLGFMRYRQRFAAQIERVSHAIQRWMPRLVKYGALLLGVIVAIDAGLRLIAG
jgi:cytochrome c biogenesis protein CcdA